MRIGILLEIMAVSLGLAVGAPAQASLAPLPDGTRINVELKSKLDTKHAKVGDKVTAVTTADVKDHGLKLLPKGSLLAGEVTQVVAAESNKSPSRIAVHFDQATTKQGQVIALSAGIDHIDLPSAASNSMLNMNAGPIAPPNQPPNADGMNRGTIGGDAAPPPQITAPDREMNAMTRASNGAQVRVIPAPGGGIVSSSRGDIQLDPGTRLELQVEPPPSPNHG